MSHENNSPAVGARALSERPESTRAAVLLVNVGTPDAPKTGAVRRYLRQFLSDPRMVEIPRALWWPILYGVILPFRAPRSAKAYRRVWTDEGSPLLTHSRGLSDALQAHLAQAGQPVRVQLAMRYGRPAIREVLDRLAAENIERLLVLPLYPQYSATTTASVFDQVAAAFKHRRRLPELRFISHYHHEPAWQDAVAASIRAFQTRHGVPDKLLFSFHGLPKRSVALGDPYYHQCLASARGCAARLGLAEDQWAVGFQSRLGRAEWLQPYTSEVLKDWGRSRIGKVQVVCPGFASDCLETLDEIAIENQRRFTAAGGGEMQYIPALNADPAHVQALAEICRKHGQGWPGLQENF